MYVYLDVYVHTSMDVVVFDARRYKTVSFGEKCYLPRENPSTPDCSEHLLIVVIWWCFGVLGMVKEYLFQGPVWAQTLFIALVPLLNYTCIHLWMWWCLMQEDQGRPRGPGRAPSSHEPLTINSRLANELFDYIL